MEDLADVVAGVATAWRWRADADAVAGAGAGRRESFDRGAELGRVVGVDEPFVADCISPAAAETLFVNEEIAQPVQEDASLG